ncbi:MAG: tRNA (N6-threonylcarbamoyladenosine(37)-N6)-methyltransferase TrmO [Tyzzerella sp.]|nr:tRNA (N6-threonylcarbamoyladenosine(37)-N6)-methyltransferase TrmO [Tyzzerella sp.]
MTIEPIAYIRTDFKEKFGIPRQSGLVKALGKIVFEQKYRTPDALRGIEGFSHLWLIFDFSMSHRDGWSPTVRPPRLGGNERIGVFASRSPFRPNNIGLSSVELVRKETTADEGDVLIVRGADLLDMTPIYDIKPYLPYSDAHSDARAGYTDSRERKRLTVKFPDDLLKLIPEDKQGALIGCIAEDPRPSYQKDESRIYSMRFAEFDVSFRVENNIAFVMDVKIFD